MNANELKIAYLSELQKTTQCDLTFCLSFAHIIYGSIDHEIKSLRQAKDSVTSLLTHTKNKIIKLLQEIAKVEVKIDELEREMDISLSRNGQEIPGTMTCIELLRYKKKLKFKIFGTTYRVVVNAPLVNVITLPNFIYVNTCVRPLRLKGIHFDKRLSKYKWSKSKEKENWIDVFHDMDYKTTHDDLCHYLKLTCRPFSNDGTAGPVVEVVSENIVDVLPDLPSCSMEYRKNYTNQNCYGKSFRVVSYNTLAERYTDDDQFIYCEPGFLAIDYRKQLIFEELINYKADIICLQEVDFDHYHNYFKERFKNSDYIPVFYKKGHVIPEGLSLVFDRNRFKQLECKHIVLAHELKRNPIFKDVWKLIKKRKEVKELFIKQHTSLLVATLKVIQTNDIVIIANTHLYYHREAAHIRILQVAMALIYIKYHCQRTKPDKTGKISVIFCGDFNSRPDTAVYHFLTQGNLRTYSEDDLESIGSCRSNIFQHDFNFESACGTPKFTNYTEDFKGCLDYIFCQKDVKILQALPFPPEEEVARNVALPNQYFPSDHIALVADLML